jgi:hypothetical protein
MFTLLSPQFADIGYDLDSVPALCQNYSTQGANFCIMNLGLEDRKIDSLDISLLSCFGKKK